MSLFANRRTAATHIRPVTLPGVKTRRTELGAVYIGFPEETFIGQALDGVSAPSAEMTIFIDPDDDIKNGDLLRFESPIDGVTYDHEVVWVRRFPAGKRVDNAEATVGRREAAK